MINYKNWKWAAFFPRMWLIRRMKVFKASRTISASAALDGARIGSFRPAKQIVPSFKIWAISILFPPALVLRFLRLTGMLAKIPDNLKSTCYCSKIPVPKTWKLAYMSHSAGVIWTLLDGQIGIEMGKRALDMPSMSWFVHGLADAKEQAKKSKAATLPTTISVKSGEFGGYRAAFIPSP